MIVCNIFVILAEIWFNHDRIWQQLSLRFLVMTRPARKYSTSRERNMSHLMD